MRRPPPPPMALLPLMLLALSAPARARSLPGLGVGDVLEIVQLSPSAAAADWGLLRAPPPPPAPLALPGGEGAYQAQTQQQQQLLVEALLGLRERARLLQRRLELSEEALLRAEKALANCSAELSVASHEHARDHGLLQTRLPFSGPFGFGHFGTFGPFGGGSFGHGPFGNGLFGNGPFGNGPFGSGPFGNGPFGGGLFGHGPFGGGLGGWGGGIGAALPGIFTGGLKPLGPGARPGTGSGPGVVSNFVGTTSVTGPDGHVHGTVVQGGNDRPPIVTTFTQEPGREPIVVTSAGDSSPTATPTDASATVVSTASATDAATATDADAEPMPADR